MMRFIILFSLLSVTSYADDTSKYGTWNRMNYESFRGRFRLKGEIFILDSSGKRVQASSSEVRVWQPGLKSEKIDSHWRVSEKTIEPIALHHVWELKEDNSIAVHIQQYDRIDDDQTSAKKKKYGKLIREESMVLENFASVSWVAEANKDFRVVVRFTPEIEDMMEGGPLEKILIGGNRNNFQVSDNQGYMWAENARFGGALAGLKCYRGSLIFSYYPFKGAKEMGFAFGKVIELNLTDDLKVKIRSDSDLIPGEMKAKVYVKYMPQLKSSGFGDTTTFGQDKLDGFPPEMR